LVALLENERYILFASLPGDEWKDIRSTFSPIFTSGKLKGMSRLIEDVSHLLVQGCEEEMAKSGEIDFRVVFGKFSMDTIASCAFGVDAQSFTNDRSQFVRNARAVSDYVIMQILCSFIA
jgi:cytochrome P450 family 9